jgi:hypothetical protein
VNRHERRKRNAILRQRSPKLIHMDSVKYVSNRLSEVALRMVVETDRAPLQVIGTAFLAAPGIAITAAHNVEEVFRLLQIDPTTLSEAINGSSIKLYQIMPGIHHVIWWVVSLAYIKGVDLAVLEIELHSHSGVSPAISHNCPRLMVNPPTKGAGITAHGYRNSRLTVEANETGQAIHVSLNDDSMLAKGKVTEIYYDRRDSFLMPFPCFEVDVRFESGLSGGPVIDHATGGICGVVCTGFDDGRQTAKSTSYASLLWPALGLRISNNRYPTITGIVDPILLDIALTIGHPAILGLHTLDPRQFPGRELRIEQFKIDATQREQVRF